MEFANQCPVAGALKGGMIASLFVLRILQELNFKDYA